MTNYEVLISRLEDTIEKLVDTTAMPNNLANHLVEQIHAVNPNQLTLRDVSELQRFDKFSTNFLKHKIVDSGLENDLHHHVLIFSRSLRKLPYLYPIKTLNQKLKEFSFALYESSAITSESHHLLNSIAEITTINPRPRQLKLDSFITQLEECLINLIYKASTQNQPTPNTDTIIQEFSKKILDKVEFDKQ